MSSKKPDPRKVNAAHLVRQINLAPAPKGSERTFYFDLMAYEMPWDPAHHRAAPTGIRLQIWNKPNAENSSGKLLEVSKGDFLAVVAEGIRDEKKLSPEHREHEAVKSILGRGVGFVEYQHAFLIDIAASELAADIQNIEHVFLSGGGGGVERLYHAATEGTAPVYSLLARSHENDFRSEKGKEAIAKKVYIDGLKLRKLLRNPQAECEDNYNALKGYSLQGGDVLALAYHKKGTDEIEHIVLIPRWIAECMLTTYLRTLMEIMPGLIQCYPAVDEWA